MKYNGKVVTLLANSTEQHNKHIGCLQPKTNTTTNTTTHYKNTSFPSWIEVFFIPPTQKKNKKCARMDAFLLLYLFYLILLIHKHQFCLSLLQEYLQSSIRELTFLLSNNRKTALFELINQLCSDASLGYAPHHCR